MPGQKRGQLKEQLYIGECSAEDRALQKMILSHHNIFALSDEELGETSLVEHEITLTDRAPITTPPRRLPYTLHTELEEELECSLNTG